MILLYLILIFLYFYLFIYSIKTRTHLLIIIFSIAFLQGVLTLIGIKQLHYQFVLEFAILLFFINSLYYKKKINRKYEIPGIAYFIIYLLCVYFSYRLNNSELYTSVLFSRNILVYYLFFLGIINCNYNEIKIIKINKLIIIFFLLQIPASIVKYFLIGQKELYIGTISINAGTLSTIVPLFCIGFITSYYLNKNKNIYIFICLLAGFVFMSFVGAKRAFFLLLPFIIGMTYLFSSRKKMILSGILSLKLILFTGIIGFLVIYAGSMIIPSFNPEDKIGGSFDPEYMINFTTRYLNKYGYGGGVATGRLSSTGESFYNVLENRPLFGYGPDALYGSATSYIGKGMKYNIAGGRTGFTFHVISVGFLGTLALISFYIYLTSKFFKIKINSLSLYYRTLFIGAKVATALFFIDFFTYSRVSMYNYIPGLIIFYLWGIYHKKFSRNSISKVNMFANNR